MSRHRVGGHAADPLFQPADLVPDLLLVGTLEESAEHVLGVEQPEVDPEQPVQAGELEVLERQGLIASGQLFRGPHLLGNLPEPRIVRAGLRSGGADAAAAT